MVDESSSIPLHGGVHHHVIIHPEHLAGDSEVLVRNIELYGTECRLMELHPSLS